MKLQVIRLIGKLNQAICAVLIGLVRAYQFTISPMLGPSCRFIPTCSEYAVEAIKAHGPIRGCYLSIRRVIKCRPGGAHGFDPVPAKQPRPDSTRES